MPGHGSVLDPLAATLRIRQLRQAVVEQAQLNRAEPSAMAAILNEQRHSPLGVPDQPAVLGLVTDGNVSDRLPPHTPRVVHDTAPQGSSLPPPCVADVVAKPEDHAERAATDRKGQIR